MLVCFLISLIGFLEIVQAPLSPAIIEDIRSSSVKTGWIASPGQFPYHVRLHTTNLFGMVSTCGGVLAQRRWIITAAHCVANRNLIVAQFGVTNPSGVQDWQEEKITKYHIHPRYKEPNGGVQADDIALLELDKDLAYGDYIQPCRIQSSRDKDKDYNLADLTITGFGHYDDDWSDDGTTQSLRWEQLSGVGNSDCRNMYGGNNLIEKRTVCGKSTQQSPCQGDSGSPLTIVDTDGQSTLIGILSFGSSVGCTNPFPAGFIRPGYYHAWFYQVTGINFETGKDGIPPTTELASHAGNNVQDLEYKIEETTIDDLYGVTVEAIAENTETETETPATYPGPDEYGNTPFFEDYSTTEAPKKRERVSLFDVVSSLFSKELYTGEK